MLRDAMRRRPHRNRRQRFREDGAGLLAAIAILALIGMPLVHAEEHYREAHPDDEELAALAEEWEAGSRDPFDVLVSALRHVHQSGPPDPARHEHPGHSHGPAGAPHGSGSLMHFALALHSAPQLPAVAPCPAAHEAPHALAAQLRGTLAYLVPEWSQGPPPRC
jgi:hypothetical protein